MTSSPTSSFSIEELEDRLAKHRGWRELERFGENLHDRPLERHQLRVFLASTCEFFREIPGGILALALRVTDDWMERDRFGAVARAGSVLYSAVDEYGLHDCARGIQKGHHTLFHDMAQQWGVTLDDLMNPALILPEAVSLARLTRDYYRSRDLGAGLGFHFASEKTSDREFVLCNTGFSRHWQAYNLTDARDPTLEFYYIHTLVEPMHGSTSADAVCAQATLPGSPEQIIAGAVAFMEGYGAFWAALNAQIALDATHAHHAPRATLV